MMAPSGGDRESGGLSQAGVCVQVPAAANDRSTTAAAMSELLRRLLPPTGAFLLYPTPTWCLLKSAQNESLGFSAGNTSAQLVPRVFSLGSSSCCTLVTMLTIYPLVHHVMKKASNCVCSTLCTFHSSILKKTGITCMAIIIQFHDGWKILFCTFGSSHYWSGVHTVAVTLFTHPIIIKQHCKCAFGGNIIQLQEYSKTSPSPSSSPP